MDAQRLARLQEVFDAALERPASERDAFLEAACGDDADLRNQVRRLLRAGDAAHGGAFVVGAVRAATMSLGAAADHAGLQLGPYRLVRELGHGGMGTVWLAERVDDAYRARVAIKLVRGGFASPELARRFRAERQILADLHHPHVAALLDGGEAPDGTPYLVMEYIDGAPVTTYASAHALPLRERLRLFCQVCDAVQHAHGSLVVHRDIKPSNVLVGADDAPKLLDFGIAKLVNQDAEAETTGFDRRLTPSYASPEQLRGDRVTVATDVYSLGVLLYELVAGVHPFAADGAATDEVCRRVLEVEPVRPSEALRRRPTAGVRAHEVAGDLDNIVAKAMRKEPEMRYASVAHLSDDIARMLQGQPVLARAASMGYRARKFAARHTAAVGGVVLLFLSLVSGLSATLWQARRADRARGAAEAALDESNEVKDFLTSLFRASDPSENKGASITARELLDRGVQRLDTLDGQPGLQADILDVLAHVEMSLGEYRTAKEMFDREIGIRRSLPGPADSMLVKAVNGLASAYDRLGIPDSSAAASEEAIAMGRAALGVESPGVIAAYNNLGNVYARMGRDEDAESALREAIRLQRRAFGPNALDLAFPMNDLGLMYATEGRYTEAEPLLRESLRLCLLADSTSVTTADALDNLGMMLRESGRYDEAEPYMRRAFAIRRRTLGPEARFTGESYFSLGYLLALRGRERDLPESDSLLHAALNVFRATLGPTHRAVAYPMHALGVLALRRGNLAAAERWYDQALAIREHSTEDAPRETVRTLVRLGQVQLLRRERGADTTLRRADSLARARLDSMDPVRNRAAIGEALVLARRGDVADAGPMYLHGVTLLAERIGRTHPLVREACAAGHDAGLSGGRVCGGGGG